MINPEKFKSFLDDYDLSIRKFSDATNNIISKSSVSYFTRPDLGGLSNSFVKKVTPLMIEATANCLRKFDKSETEINEIIFEIYYKEYSPMLVNRTKLDEEVLDFFNFQRDPFALESDPKKADQVFSNLALERVAKRIEDAVYFQGLLAVLAPIGAGKTTIKNRVAASLKAKGKVHFIFPKFAEMNKLGSGSIIHYLLEYFGLQPRHRLAMAQAQLEKHLAHLSEQGIKVAIGIDEAHRINDETLSAVKNFYEIGSGGYDRYLGMILFGQLSFKLKLDDIQFREIAERIEIVEMPSLSKCAAEYVSHRLHLAGADVNKIFDSSALQEISKQATTPLAIGNLANKALMNAYKKGERFVTSRYVDKDIEPKTRKVGSAK